MTPAPPGGRDLRFVFHYPETNGPEGSGLDAGPLLEPRRNPVAWQFSLFGT